MKTPEAEKPPEKESPESPETPPAEPRKIGHMSDYFEEGGPEFYPTDPKALAALLESVHAPRDERKEVDVPYERKRTASALEEVNRAIASEEKRDASLGEVRESLKKPHEKGKELSKLEEAKEKLTEDAEKVELAAEYNDVLESLGTLSDEDLEHIAKTGQTKEGKTLRNKKGKEVKRDAAKQLAALASSGATRLTWGAVNKLYSLVDKVLDDLKEGAKTVARAVFGGGGKKM